MANVNQEIDTIRVGDVDYEISDPHALYGEHDESAPDLTDNPLYESDLLSQIVNDPTKPSAANVPYQLKQEINQLNSDLTSYTGSHILATSGGPAGNQTLATLQQWCKEHDAIYFTSLYYTNIFGNWYWSMVFIDNKLIAPGYAQIVIINHIGICFSQTSQLGQTTPTWNTGQTLFTSV